MPKYRVSLTQKVYEEATIYVIADNEEEAEKAATEYNSANIEWHFLEANDPSEIVSIEVCDTNQ
jgi:hypothetical protein